jgi:hypothetical protein
MHERQDRVIKPIDRVIKPIFNKSNYINTLQGPEIDFLKNAAVFHHRPELLDLLSPDFVILKVLKGII